MNGPYLQIAFTIAATIAPPIALGFAAYYWDKRAEKKAAPQQGLK